MKSLTLYNRTLVNPNANDRLFGDGLPRRHGRRMVARRPLLLTLALCLGVAYAAEAAGPRTQTQNVDVMTHSSQGDVRVVNVGGARMIRSDDGVFVNLEARDLQPNHAYTMWVVAINAPQHCSEAPCQSSDVMKNTDQVKADLGYGDGAVAGMDGKARFAAFQPTGAMAHSWFGRGLMTPDAEIHLVIRDHGPLVQGREAAMLSTFRDGCNAESVADTLPQTAQSNGRPGTYKCANVQAAVFKPAG